MRAILAGVSSVRALGLVLVIVSLAVFLIGAFVPEVRAEDAPMLPGPEGEVVVPEEAAKPRNLRTSANYREYQTTTVDRVRSASGVFVLLALCAALSRSRRNINWRLVGIGVGLQITFALLVLGNPAGREVFRVANEGIIKLLDFGKRGSRFLFASQETGQVESALRNFAFEVLPSIVFFSSLMAVLYHLGVMQMIVRGISWLMQRTMRTSGAETLAASATIFVGQTEAPLLVRPFVAGMTKSELLVIMSAGMANTAGGVLAAYVGMLYAFFPDIAGHLLAESIMSAPAALVTAKLLWPEDGTPATLGGMKLDVPKTDANAVEAAARGASEGLTLAFNVAAMLIAFIALVALLDGGLGAATTLVGLPEITFQKIAGWVFFPFAWVMGVPFDDCAFVGELLGQKLVLNEFVAYGSLSQALTDGTANISERGMLITSYALAGFANFGSIGILIGGIGALAPERRGDVAKLGFYALVGGSCATFMTACIAGVLG